MKSFLVLFVFSIFFISCKEEVDVNAPWKDVTVVYGLLNKKDSTHYIKVNKAFLGEGSALQMAQIRDSNEYKNVKVSLKKIINGNIQESEIIFSDTVLSNKEDGVFYSPEHTIYYSNEVLDAGIEYYLEVNVNNGEKISTSKTGLIEAFNLGGGPIFGNPITTVGFALGDNKYSDQIFSWQSVKYGKAYQLTLTFYYEEHYFDGTFNVKSFDWVFPVQKSFNVSGGQNMSQKIEGESFYQQIASRIKPISESVDVKFRKFLPFQFSMTVGGDELNTYLEVNAPTTGVVFEKPEYTNITNGIGIFSTRMNVTSNFLKNINDNSLIELYNGQYTKDLGFCSNSGANACP